MTENYVTFKTAKLLKEKGFDEICRAFWKDWNEQTMLCHCCSRHVFEWCHNSMLENHYNDNEETNIAAPTLQMANQFLRVKYHLHISIGFNSNGYMWHIINCENDNCYSHGQKGGFKTAEDANNDALNICLTDIIKFTEKNKEREQREHERMELLEQAKKGDENAYQRYVTFDMDR